MSREFNIKDISTLPADWQTWAKEVDSKSDNDGKINSILEFDAVKDRAIAAGKTEDEVNEIFGLSLSSAKSNAVDNQNSPTEELSSSNNSDLTKTQQKSKKVIVITKLKNLVASHQLAENRDRTHLINWDDVLQDLKKELEGTNEQGVSLANEPYYQTLLQEVNTVINDLKARPYGSRSSVKNLHFMASQSLDSVKGGDSKFRKEVLTQLVKLIEKDQVLYENKVLTDRYIELSNSGMTREQCIKQLSSEFKGSYYKDYSDTELGSNSDTETKYAGLITQLENGIVLDSARNEVWKAIYDIKKDPNLNANINTKKDLINAVKARLGDKLDKYAKKVLGGELSFSEKVRFEESTTKAYINKAGSDIKINRLKASTELDEEYFTDKLKNKSLFDELRRCGLIEERKNEDGTPLRNKDNKPVYDLTKLSEEFGKLLGSDNKLNRQRTEFGALSELNRSFVSLMATLGSPATELSNGDIKALAKLCGYDVERKNWWKVAVDTLDKTLLNGLGGALAMVLTPSEMVGGTVSGVVNGTVSGNTSGPVPFTYQVNMNGTIQLDLALEGAQISRSDYLKIIRQVSGQYGTVCSYDDYLKTGKLSIIIDLSKHPDSSKLGEGVIDNATLPFSADYSQEYEQDYNDKAGKSTEVKMFLYGLMFNLATNFLTAASAEKAECPAIPTQFKATKIEAYEAEINADKTLNQNQKNGLILLARTFIDDEGAWKVEDFKQTLNKFAGDGGILNKTELAIGMFEAEQERLEVKPTKEEDKKDEVKDSEETKEKTVTVDEVVEHNGPTYRTEMVETEPVSHQENLEFDYSSADGIQHHTWQGFIKTYYQDALNDGVTEKEIRNKIRAANNLKPGDNFIPAKIYLPDIEVKGKYYSKKEGVTEQDIYKNDAKFEDKKAPNRSHKVTMRSQLVVINGKRQYYGIKMLNGKEVKTDIAYDTEGEALAAASLLVDPE